MASWVNRINRLISRSDRLESWINRFFSRINRFIAWSDRLTSWGNRLASRRNRRYSGGNGLFTWRNRLTSGRYWRTSQSNWLYSRGNRFPMGLPVAANGFPVGTIGFPVGGLLARTDFFASACMARTTRRKKLEKVNIYIIYTPSLQVFLPHKICVRDKKW